MVNLADKAKKRKDNPAEVVSEEAGSMEQPSSGTAAAPKKQKSGKNEANDAIKASVSQKVYPISNIYHMNA